MCEIEQLERNGFESLYQGFGAVSCVVYRVRWTRVGSTDWADLKAEKLEPLIAEARAELEQGKARPL